MPAYMEKTPGNRKALERAKEILASSYPEFTDGPTKAKSGKYYALLATFYRTVCGNTPKYNCEGLEEMTLSGNVGAYMVPLGAVRVGREIVPVAALKKKRKKRKGNSESWLMKRVNPRAPFDPYWWGE